jgi:Transglycosylase SLT domain
VPLLVAAGVLAACSGGGGGQLAEESGDETTMTSAPGAPVRAGQLETPRTAREAADELTETETGLRGTDRDPATLEELGERQQLAYRALATHPHWVAGVVAEVPASVRPAVQHNVDADAALAQLTGSGVAPTTLPDWTILEPQPAETLRGYYEEAEAASGIPWQYLAAIHLVETHMGRIHGNSPAGAQGPMQFIPETWERYGEGDITDDRDAILAAGRYLDDRGGPEDMDRALFSYNNDDRYVEAVREYATVMLDDPLAYHGYHAWRVFFGKADGTVMLPEGFGGVRAAPDRTSHPLTTGSRDLRSVRTHG